MVLAAGVFDLLHAGHVAYLESARSMGSMLVVGVNGDASARTLGKGPGRPINRAADRASVIRALRCVDAVVVFDETTPEQLILALKPEIFAKGGDYRAEELPEAPAVHSYGGMVAIIPRVADYSTTQIVSVIRG
jgi:rfaE bifunctional protein nucleotidyltransferase chain/domain